MGQPELAFEMPRQAQLDQKEVEQFQRRKLVFVNHFVVPEHLFRTAPRPVEMSDRPVDENALERHGFGQSNGPVFARVLKC